MLRISQLQVQVPPEAAHFSLKMTVFGELYCAVLYWEGGGREGGAREGGRGDRGVRENREGRNSKSLYS